jgi:hypothetical protein
MACYLQFLNISPLRKPPNARAVHYTFGQQGAKVKSKSAIWTGISSRFCYYSYSIE